MYYFNYYTQIVITFKLEQYDAPIDILKRTLKNKLELCNNYNTIQILMWCVFIRCNSQIYVKSYS